jgi:hypothetical protein
MKKLITLLFTAMIAVTTFAQSAATSPGTGHWIVIDSGYQVATSTTGKTVAPLYFHNTSTVNKITGMQFRVFYDKTAFTAVVPTLKISTTDQYLQYVDDNTGGSLTVTVVYTGTNSSFNYANGATFDLTFTHASDAVWNSLDSIKTLKISGVSSFPNLASTNMGNDTTLVVYSYGGRFNQKMLRFAGKFINTTGTNAKNLWVSLEKKAPGGSWTTVMSKATNNLGHVVFYKNIDTSYWDVRMSVKGDTMTPGSVFSTADAQKINQTVLGQYTAKGFDFYSMDVNGADGTITISDVYSVYGRLAGRFTSWPNSQTDVKFFTVSEYNSINGSLTNNVSSIPGVTNFYYYIDGKDSITYYVNVKGDANGTGFKMARLTPIKITNPSNANKYIIDNTVSYDNVTETVEITMPKVKVEDGNLVKVPVSMTTQGQSIGALQLNLKYDTSLLEFKNITNSEKVMKWTTFINPSNGYVTWGSADLTNSNFINNGDQVFTIQFIAKKPQEEWGTAVLWTAEKYVGGNNSRDITITPTMGIVEVRKVKSSISINDLSKVLVFPNPTEGEVIVEFGIKQETNTLITIDDMVGRRVQELLNERLPAGKYKYVTDLRKLENGLYLLSIKTEYSNSTTKIIVNK